MWIFASAASTICSRTSRDYLESSEKSRIFSPSLWLSPVWSKKCSCFYLGQFSFHMYTHTVLFICILKRKFLPLMRRTDAKEWEQQHFHNTILLFWSDLFLKRKKMQRTWSTHKSTFSSKVVYHFMNHMWWMRFMN